ncbi:hypothetical protein FQN50_009141 [Emmonsiellopsis sp. PD_5]|nr:hypothetical protein FQN50_009141 [Emmonsiellopsis sp. PD_5]
MDTASTSCSNCNKCVTCMVVRTLLIHNLQFQSNQERLARANTQEYCRELWLLLSSSEHQCETLEVALNEARNYQLEMNKELAMERNKHTATQVEYSILFSENQTLWQLFDETTLIPGESGTLATIQELYHNNQEQALLIQKLEDKVQSLHGVESSVEGLNDSCDYWWEMTDIDDDDNQPKEDKPALKLLPSLFK